MFAFAIIVANTWLVSIVALDLPVVPPVEKRHAVSPSSRGISGAVPGCCAIQSERHEEPPKVRSIVTTLATLGA